MLSDSSTRLTSVSFGVNTLGRFGLLRCNAAVGKIEYVVLLGLYALHTSRILELQTLPICMLREFRFIAMLGPSLLHARRGQVGTAAACIIHGC